ncbi:uncharacterized protein LOC133739555 [Rosa rugosa]|uniref:uncharacterized protein LOC133739555 n=1 Tax=Rosa rugosa TaxID=74645 RepID=UPI002B40C2D6|nr:uncharacterized protein LOC133739555 [Rosa rugosa]XP_062023324.1 uncharacterized protein LOC133739555 [Rosa rugosa]
MGDCWRFFRVSGLRPPQISNEYFTMEIHHGGYFDKMPDGTKKYKIAKFNKLGGVLYYDGLDPEKLTWVELDNIAWELGYREKPISYCYKLPGTLSCEGWIPVKNDADAAEMTKQISNKKRQISLYITGGGRRKKKEAELDDVVPRPSNWHNPLNNVLPAEKINIDVSANLVASQINRLYMEKVVGVGVRSSVNGRRDDLITNDNGVNEGVLGEGLNVVKNDSEVGRDLSEVVNEGSVVENAVKVGNEDEEGHEGNLNTFNVAVRRPTFKKSATRQEKGKAAIIEAPLEASGFKKKGRQVKGSKYKTRNEGKKKYDKVDSDYGSGGSDFFIDSDYEQDQKDDDVDFEENVANPERVEEYDEMGYNGLCSDDERESHVFMLYVQFLRRKRILHYMLTNSFTHKSIWIPTIQSFFPLLVMMTGSKLIIQLLLHFIGGKQVDLR